MSKPNNTVILIGRITKEPEVKEVGKDNAVLRFTLAVDDGVVNGEKVTQFLSCVAWNNLADIVGKYVKKGDMLAVSGKLQENNYEKEGVMQYTTQVLCTDITLLPNLKAAESDSKPQQSNTRKYSRKG